MEQEECDSGTHAWHEIVVEKGFSDNDHTFTEQVKVRHLCLVPLSNECGTCKTVTARF
jgi:hypothetical protein